MRERDGHLVLEPRDLVRMNQLIQPELDVGGFETWYKELNESERQCLVFELIQAAAQAGVSSTLWANAVAASGIDQNLEILSPEPELSRGNTIVALAKWARKARMDAERWAVFKLCVHLFALADARVRTLERGSKFECNHWWHKDLHNPAILKEVLSSPGMGDGETTH